MSREIKRELYRQGRYQFKAPPVYCAMWGEESWIDYIDACKGWRPQMP